MSERPDLRYVIVRLDNDGVRHFFDSDETQVPLCGRLRDYGKSYKVLAVRESTIPMLDTACCVGCQEAALLSLEKMRIDRASSD